jgi:hypothetical protein
LYFYLIRYFLFLVFSILFSTCLFISHFVIPFLAFFLHFLFLSFHSLIFNFLIFFPPFSLFVSHSSYCIQCLSSSDTHILSSTILMLNHLCLCLFIEDLALSYLHLIIALEIYYYCFISFFFLINIIFQLCLPFNNKKTCRQKSKAQYK